MSVTETALHKQWNEVDATEITQATTATEITQATTAKVGNGIAADCKAISVERKNDSFQQTKFASESNETDDFHRYATQQILEDFNKVNANVSKAYEIFEKTYESAFEKTYISDIVNGETINISPENILIDNADMQDDAVNFAKRLKACSKKLYDYQVKAIKTILQLERDGYHINPVTKTKTVSNAWILSLPIGSGKSIVFLFLALWYRNVPKHPIIISKAGSNLPLYEQLQFKYYPFYYESCSYEEYLQEDGSYDSNENCVVTYENYQQQPTTVILTHSHLLEQMRRYLLEDFPMFCKGKGTNINICQSVAQMKTNDDIVIIPAYEQNVKDLVEISHDKPFMRVIVDDYTSMSGIDNFRQILASSTIFISGSGFERDVSLIPTSYYTMKLINTKAISIVGYPEETYKGVVRNNIAMIKLLGSSCDFSVYNFVQKVDEIVLSLYNTTPKDLYPLLKSNSIRDYMGLYFIIVNRDKLRNAINAIDKDYNITGRYRNAKYSDKQYEVKYFIEWLHVMLNDATTNKATTITANKANSANSSTNKATANSVNSSAITAKRNVSNYAIDYKKLMKNKLLSDLFSYSSMQNNNESTPIVMQVCICCKRQFIEHNGYGVVTSCCGAFYCENCVKNATTTHIITDDLAKCDCKQSLPVDLNRSACNDCKQTTTACNDCNDCNDCSNNIYTVTDGSYYCSCCRSKNMKLLVNMSKKKDKSIYAYNLIDSYFNNSNLANSIKFDYYFYMLLHGLTPTKHEGKPINVTHEIRKGIMQNVKDIGQIRKIYSLDHLMIYSLDCINKSLVAVKQTYDYIPYLLFYNAPKYMESRITGYIEDFAKRNKANPIAKMKSLFMNGIDSLIGIHLNVVGIIVFNFKDTTKDGVKQLLGRCLRINTFNNKLTFFITPDLITFA